MSIISTVEGHRIIANKYLDPKRKSALGQFFTPAPISQFMASLFTDISGDVELLDPGCGVGSLLAAFTEEAIKRGSTSSMKIDAVDVEEKIRPYLLETLGLCKIITQQAAINFSATAVQNDFIATSVKRIKEDATAQNGFSHVIMNPPYKKINTNGVERKLLSTVGIETVNLYSAFVALAIKLLKPDGELVAIIPRSFCNGPYYESFRKLLLSQMSFRHIHLFDSRDNAFGEDDVLQENIILHCQKNQNISPIKITSSPAANFHYDDESDQYTVVDMTIRKVEMKSIVNPEDRHKFIHIAATQREQSIVDTLSCFNSTLDDLNLEVSTGPVVDFRVEQCLRSNSEKGAVPLLYPNHLADVVRWPVESKKPNFIMANNLTLSSLWENKGSYIITRRFSSKEEKRRIVATYYDSELPYEYIGFENKLNVFHFRKTGFSSRIAKGLYIYLNSTLLDKYYRQFGGHTQVNASDLRAIHYPSSESLERIGERVSSLPTEQSEIDNLLNEEIHRMTGKKDNPIAAQQKLDEALEVLKAIGMPREQQNERSALTLLALLSLTPNKKWSKIERPTLGVTPIMDWSRDQYGKEYAPNTRETFRRQTLHQFLEAGLILINPDKPDRVINSPKTCYQIVPEAFDLLVTFRTKHWNEQLEKFRSEQKGLAQKYAMERNMALIPLKIEKTVLELSAGPHSKLIRDIILEFGPRFAPESTVLYIGDTGDKNRYVKKEELASLGIEYKGHGKMPDVILHYHKKDWLLLIESVTSHGPVDGKRHAELSELFKSVTIGIVYVTVFPDRQTMNKYSSKISWETEVWIADSPTHMIHFNGDRFLGPHK